MEDRNLPEEGLYSWHDPDNSDMPLKWVMPDYEYQTSLCYTPEEIQDKFKAWCKETRRTGSVLVAGSIREFFEYLKIK